MKNHNISIPATRYGVKNGIESLVADISNSQQSNKNYGESD